MLRKFSRLFFLLASLALISVASGARCYRCRESGYLGDVRNCRETVDCRHGCKVIQVSSNREVYVEQDCFDLSFPYTSGSTNNNNNDNVSPTYVPQTQYQSNYPQSLFPSRQLPPVVFNPHNPDNREYGNGYDNTNNYGNNNFGNNNNNQGNYGGCSTYSAIMAFRRLFPYSGGYSATCNTCDYDYCNTYNGSKRMGASMTLAVLVLVLIKSLM